jgi:polypeptide N-acetylgalactosaminyltransferase
MRTAFKPFLLGIVITSVTWTVILYFYFVLNPLPAGLVHPSTAHQIVQKLSRSKTFSHTSIEEHEHVKETGKKNSGLGEDFGDDLGLVRTKEDQQIREDGYRHHAFNVLVSSRLDYHREIPDTRHKM